MTRARGVVPAAFLVAFALAGVLGSLRLPIGSVHQPGPGFFPLALAAALLVTSVALLVHALRAPLAPPTAAPAVSASRSRTKAVLALLALFAYAFVMEQVGFTIGTFVLLLFLFLVVEPKRWIIAVGGSALTAVVSWIVFKVWLGVELPIGPWGF